MRNRLIENVYIVLIVEIEFFVDCDDECINEFDSPDDSDFEFELADFCSGGDLTED